MLSCWRRPSPCCLKPCWECCARMRVAPEISGAQPLHRPRHALWHASIASSPSPCRPRSSPPASPAGELAGQTEWSHGRDGSIAGPSGCRRPGWAPNPHRPACSQGLPGLRPPQRGGHGPAAAGRGPQPPAAAGGPGGTGGSAGGAPCAGRPLRRRQGGARALREGHGEVPGHHAVLRKVSALAQQSLQGTWPQQSTAAPPALSMLRPLHVPSPSPLPPNLSYTLCQLARDRCPVPCPPRRPRSSPTCATRRPWSATRPAARRPWQACARRSTTGWRATAGEQPGVACSLRLFHSKGDHGGRAQGGQLLGGALPLVSRLGMALFGCASGVACFAGLFRLSGG